MSSGVHPARLSAVADDEHDAFVDDTLTLWQPLSREPLTRADARRIASDVGDFLAILADWDRMEREGAEARPRTHEAEVGGGVAAGASSAKSARRRHA